MGTITLWFVLISVCTISSFAETKSEDLPLWEETVSVVKDSKSGVKKRTFFNIELISENCLTVGEKNSKLEAENGSLVNLKCKISADKMFCG